MCQLPTLSCAVVGVARKCTAIWWESQLRRAARRSARRRGLGASSYLAVSAIDQNSEDVSEHWRDGPNFPDARSLKSLPTSQFERRLAPPTRGEASQIGLARGRLSLKVAVVVVWVPELQAK